MTNITNRLLTAYRVTIPARAALANVAWPEIPGLLRALGCDLSPEDAAVVAAGLAETDSRGQMSARRLLSVRGILALAGDRARAARHHGGHEHCSLAAVEEMCVELVGLLGSALALLDTADRITYADLRRKT